MDEKYTKQIEDIAQQRRARIMALAFLKRASKAGIPERYRCINKNTFKNILLEDYHPADNIANFVYDNVIELMKTPFILIDGGDTSSRKMAGFAILFRLITCDMYGLYKRCNELEADLSEFTSFSEVSRKSWASQYQKNDIMYIDDFQTDLFKPHRSGGNFLDDILEYRSDHLKPTIITFRKPISLANVLYETHCGDCIRRLSQKEYPDSYIKEGTRNLKRVFESKIEKPNPYNGILRIRVKLSGEN